MNLERFAVLKHIIWCARQLEKRLARRPGQDGLSIQIESEAIKLRNLAEWIADGQHLTKPSNPPKDLRQKAADVFEQMLADIEEDEATAQDSEEDSDPEEVALCKQWRDCTLQLQKRIMGHVFDGKGIRGT